MVFTDGVANKLKMDVVSRRVDTTNCKSYNAATAWSEDDIIYSFHWLLIDLRLVVPVYTVLYIKDWQNELDEDRSTTFESYKYHLQIIVVLAWLDEHSTIHPSITYQQLYH